MEDILRSSTLLFVLLNPFMMSVYLMDLFQDLDRATFRRVLSRGAIISSVVFVLFAWLGDAVFRDILQARFASFLIFGGLVFLVIGYRFVFVGSETFRSLRGKPEHLEGSIAMPFMIGPGTISASVLAGGRLDKPRAALAIAVTMIAVVLSLVILKWVYDRVRERNESLVQRYTEITGRVMALVIGTYAVEMILQGLDLWLGTR